MKRTASIIMLQLLWCPLGMGDTLPSLCSNRSAIEHVYYEHRSGTKKPFAETMPAPQIEQLVKLDSHKEDLLKNIYDVVITPAMVEAEVQRINATTRSPEVLAELKAALGNNAERFARSMARPLIVERLLRGHFDNDDKLHAPQRAAMAALRNGLVTAKNDGKPLAALLEQLKVAAASAEVTETAWVLTPRPPEETPAEKPPQATVPTQIHAQAGVYSVEATAQLAQALSHPGEHRANHDEKSYFDDLPAELQNVLRVQLRQPGNVSAVIEMPTGFVLYLAKTKTHEQLAVTVVSLRKRSYEQWLAQQPQ